MRDVLVIIADIERTLKNPPRYISIDSSPTIPVSPLSSGLDLRFVLFSVSLLSYSLSPNRTLDATALIRYVRLLRTGIRID